MLCEDGYLGCPTGIAPFRSLSDELNSKVLEQINSNQEMLAKNTFAQGANEFHFKKTSQERISEITSWRWVLDDLSKRLDDALERLQYELNALNVVIERVRKEIVEFSKEASRPGALTPLTDAVEDAILQEFYFLREQKKMFENMIPEVDNQMLILKETKKKIDNDVSNKQEAISVEEKCIEINRNSLTTIQNETNATDKTGKKKKLSPICRWEKRCRSLKETGLRALVNSLLCKQQIRGARIQLSIQAQAHAVRVDTALRRRLHSNKIKLVELSWQKTEAIRDLGLLDEELLTTEQNIIETLEQERVVQMRLTDRSQRPPGELTRDEVDRHLRDELRRLKKVAKHLRGNYDRITELKKNIAAAISQIDCCAEDILQVVRLDEDRIQARLDPDRQVPVIESGYLDTRRDGQAPSRANAPLAPITEDDEDDYPFVD